MSVWEKLTSSYGGDGDMNGGSVVVISSTSSSVGGGGGALETLTGAIKGGDPGRMPLGFYTMEGGEVGVWHVNVSEDGRGLMESVALSDKGKTKAQPVFVADVRSLAGGGGGGDILSEFKRSLRACLEEVKKATSLRPEISAR